jgi:hypothetical protein
MPRLAKRSLAALIALLSPIAFAEAQDAQASALFERALTLPGADIFYAEKDQVAAEEMAKAIESCWDKVRIAANPRFDKRITLYLYPDSASYDASREKAGLPVHSKYRSHHVAPAEIHVRATMHSGDAVHELAHLVMESARDPPFESPWIDESICASLAGQSTVNRGGFRTSFDHRAYDFTRPDLDDRYYVFAFYFIGNFIFETYPPERVAELARTGSVQAAFGVSDAEFRAAWLGWVERR